MVQTLTESLLSWLDRRGDCLLAPGLSATELDQTESRFRLRMPTDWRALLRRALPIARPGTQARYPDWREPRSARAFVDRPVDGLLFDVEHNGFWWRAWGDRPDELADRMATAQRYLADVPRLTPIGGNMYVGSTLDSPVFSIVQADLYVPALSLTHFPRGVGQDSVPLRTWPLGSVPFWSELHAWSQLPLDSRFAHLARSGTE